jgi:hypothetical protein
MRSPSSRTPLTLGLATTLLALARPVAAAPEATPSVATADHSAAKAASPPRAPSPGSPQLNDLERLTLANWSKSGETPLDWHVRGAALTVAPPTPRYAFINQILPAVEGGYSSRYGGMGGLSITLGYAASVFALVGRYRWVATQAAPGFTDLTHFHLAELGAGVQGSVGSPKHQLALEAYGAVGGLQRTGAVEDWGGVWGTGGLFTWSFAYVAIKAANNQRPNTFSGGSLGVRVGVMYPVVAPTLENPDLHIGLFFRPFGGFFGTKPSTSTHQSAR